MSVIRCKENPIITMRDIKPSSDDFEIIGVFNCGVTEFEGKTLLLLRVAEKAKDNENFARVPFYNVQTQKSEIMEFDKKDTTIDFSDVRFVKTPNQLYLTSISHLRLAYSDDMVHFTVDERPFITGDKYYEEFGVEDPRITKIDGYYYINYSAISRRGVCTVLARTKDFVSVEKLGIIFMADNKDVTIFPEKIKGKYYAMNRPVSAYFSRPEIWMSSSDNLMAYSDHNLLCDLRVDKFDSARIGASCVPFLTDKGWVEIYHGCDASNKYCLGALLLDKEDPRKILARSERPLIEAREDYEKRGFMPEVIFSCGCLVKNDVVHLYYGSCDENVCYATLTIGEVFKHLGVG